MLQVSSCFLAPAVAGAGASCECLLSCAVLPLHPSLQKWHGIASCWICTSCTLNTVWISTKGTLRPLTRRLCVYTGRAPYTEEHLRHSSTGSPCPRRKRRKGRVQRTSRRRVERVERSGNERKLDLCMLLQECNTELKPWCYLYIFSGRHV